MLDWGKYSLDDQIERINFDVITSPPGYTRRQALYGFGGRNR